MIGDNETVQLRVEDRTAWVTLDRPPLNILDIPMMRALDAALGRALPKCDFLIFQGAGSKAFSSGADVADHSTDRVEKMLSVFHAVFRRLAEADCVTMAGVHGYCLGGGMELATFCDFVLATESAQFAQPEKALSPFVLRLARRTLRRLHASEFAKQLEEVERVYLSELMKSHDAEEGVRAFLEKTAPIWKGR